MRGEMSRGEEVGIRHDAEQYDKERVSTEKEIAALRCSLVADRRGCWREICTGLPWFNK